MSAVYPKKLEEVLSRVSEIPAPAHTIYFLIKNGIIVYVGQSQWVESRVVVHSRDKDFDSYSFFEVESREQALLEEAENIIKFDPILNNELNDKYRSIPSIKIQLRREGVVGKRQFMRNIYKSVADAKVKIVDFRGKKFIKEVDFYQIVDDIVNDYMRDSK